MPDAAAFRGMSLLAKDVLCCGQPCTAPSPPPPLPCCHQVRHPGVSEAIERDFQTMVWVTHIAGQLFPSIRSLRLEDTLKQFAAPLHEQVGREGGRKGGISGPCAVSKTRRP